MKPPNCTAKEFFVIKESRPVQNETKRIKQIFDAEYKKINLTTIVMNLYYFMVKLKIVYKNYFRDMKKCLMEP